MSDKVGEISIVDGVQRFSPNGIKVVIIGAGNGGLNAALECWRKGCDVVVLERSQTLSRHGDFFTITPSALTTLHEYPRMFKKYHEKVYDCSTHIFTPSGKEVKAVVPEWKRKAVVHAAPRVNVSFLNERSEFARMQLEQCEALGIEIRFGVLVAELDENEQGIKVKTDQGEFEGDMCIAADGIGSKLPWPAPSGPSDVQDSGYAVARIAFPRNILKQDSPADKMVSDALALRPQFRTYLAHDVHLILFLTPDKVAWCFTHQTDSESTESWHNLRDPETIIKLIENANPDWDPAVLDFVRQTPGQVVDWRLMWRDSQERWTSNGGRIIKLGDAAHAFLPTAGNGAVQALEDGLSLAECLRQGGKLNIPISIKIHNTLRYQRVSVLQQTGFVNREELHFADLNAIEADPQESNSGFFKLGRWLWGHDPESYAREKFWDCFEWLAEGLNEGRDWINTNLPPGHRFERWTMRGEMERVRRGERSGLKENGYWGM